jgi:hypothetical protein
MNVFIQDRVYELLERFDTEVSIKNSQIMKAELLSPDSCAVLVRGVNTYFVLYIEDFIDDIAPVKNVIERWGGAPLRKFVLPHDKLKFSKENSYFVQPEPGQEGWAKYSVNAGGDYCFLTEIDEPSGAGYWTWIKEDA